MPPAEPPNPATFDIGNPLLDLGVYSLTGTLAQAPDGTGQVLIATIRSASTTMTCFLSAEQADDWIRILTAKRAKMTTLIIPRRGAPPDLNGGRR